MDILHLDWKNFVKDLIADPAITLRRIVAIVRDGTSLSKFQRIRAAIERADPEFREKYREECAYTLSLPGGGVDVFPYPLMGREPDVRSGVDDGYPWVEHRGRRLYFPMLMEESAAAVAYRAFVTHEGILGEGGQRAKSPHAYQRGMHRVEDGDIVVDVGCAEGLFSLDVAERARKLFLFEVLPRWQVPLERTFAPYAEKTVIVNKLVSGETSSDSVRLVDALSGEEGLTYFVKMDIEGWEGEVIAASRDFLCSHRVKLSCCAYHRQDDARNLCRLLAGMGFRTDFSDGYMLPPLDAIKPPYFRRGMIYARNFD